ncbi:MAG: carbon-nitrogen hydrolase family protein [Xanthomonadaceae bacterium]|nr:carbon-nitrogen hydrolase family protein [Xanthomonadaceae bacterium]
MSQTVGAPKVAAIQMNSLANVEANLASARSLLEQARARGVKLAALPENFPIMGRREADKLEAAEALGEGPIQAFLSRCARDLGMWIIGGTVPIRSETRPGKVAAASLVFDDAGRFVARYDKIHLFDVNLPDREERYHESATIAAGSKPVVVTTPFGRIGLSVCYDVRFPELFRHLLAEGAQILCLPAAFTAATGRAHWETLIRARAIENLCYVIAPAQSGMHESGRETWGDSMIVDPWGHVLDRVREVGAGLAVAEIDLTLQQQVRERFPSLSHRRFQVTV